MVSVLALNLYTMVVALFQRLPRLSLPAVKQFAADQSAQDAFEYLLIIGVVVVAIIGAMIAFPGLITTVITSVTNAVTGLFS